MKLPTTVPDLLRNRQKLKRSLLEQDGLVPSRIAILGGSTTAEIKSMLELFLLASGIRPTFFESGYNRYSEDVLFENRDLWTFKPDVVFFHTTWQNISNFPELLERETEVERRASHEMVRFEALWEKIHIGLGALVIQNNFDLPRLRPLGNLEASHSFTRVNFLSRLNEEFGKFARNHHWFLINDIHYLCALVGLDNWFGRSYWYNFHMALSPTAIVALARNIATIVKAVYGKSKKCLILDLDNTLWGGVVGDDGVNNLVLGRDHPVGEAFLDFQKYLKGLQERGIILAVCSKNDPDTAKEGFSHPDSVLRIEDFGSFKANWNPKPQNIREIATELNIGLESIVFVDDNPAERALVSQAIPELAIPEVGSDVSLFAEILEREGYFEVHQIVQDDLDRANYYKANAQREATELTFSDYGSFLDSLQMRAEIAPFRSLYLERITQLINKTNQFNLTTRRYTSAEVETIARDPNYIALYGRLADKFGDNGLVSVLIGQIADDTLYVEAWLMSCRVIKREMELSMFDALVGQCQLRGVRRIIGVYVRSKKNSMVATHYPELGFQPTGESHEDRELWSFDIPLNNSPRSRHIERTEDQSPADAQSVPVPVTI